MRAEYIKNETPKILIVDDISMNVEIMKNMIVAEGYEALCALSVQEAIEIMKETMPTLILSDLSMPEVDGLQFCRLVKSNPKTRDIPFIFISVMDTSEEKEQAFRAGAVDFIPKPFERVETIMRVNNQLNSYRMKQEMVNYNRMMHKLVAEQKKQLEKEQEKVLTAMAKILEKIDIDEGRHLSNVGYNCRLLAQSLQFMPKYENEITDEFVETIEVSSKLHDIGKILLPDLRNGTDETQDIERLTEQSVLLLEEIGSGEKKSRFLSMAIKIARYHHANWNGTGYPAVKGREIPLEARITTLADKFDALTDKGYYGVPLSLEESIRVINDQSGIVYEPELVDALNKIWKQLRTG